MSYRYKVPFVDFYGEYKLFEKEHKSAIQSVIARGALILQEDLELFEKELAEFLGVKHVIGVANGTDALFLSLKSLGVGPGDEVITCSYTFRATLEAILHTGAKPVLVDIGESWEQYRTERTKAIIPAHLEGKVLDWNLPDDIPVINDACQALGAKTPPAYASCYSFYPAKILGCLGDGGAVATDHDELAEWLRRVRNHDKVHGELVAWNSRLDNLQAAILRVRLSHIMQILGIRKGIAQKYDEGLNIETPEPREIYQDYIIKVEDPKALKDFLEFDGIQTMLNGYPFPTGYQKKPMTVEYENHTLRLPCNETLDYNQVDYVIDRVNEYFS